MATLAISGALALGASASTAAAVGTAVTIATTAATLASVGFSIYQALNQPTQRLEGPRLGDLQVQSSTRGAALPKVWGSMRVAGNLIHGRKYEERTEESSGGGKGFGGGGGTTQVTYSYFADMAVTLCEGPIEGIRRIWMNNKIWWTAGDDASDDADEASAANEQFFKLYKGTDTQDPDPTLEANHGAGNVPPYRHTAYLVFKRLPLKNYGNGLPNVSVEVVNTPPEVPAREDLAGDDGGELYSNFVRDPATGRYFRVGLDDGKVEVFNRTLTAIVKTITLPSASGDNEVATPCYVPTRREIWAPYNSAAGTRVAIIDADTMVRKTVLLLDELAGNGPAFYNPVRDEVVVYDDAGTNAATINVTTRAPVYADPLVPGRVFHALFIGQYELIALSGSGSTLTIQSAATYQTLAIYTDPDFGTLQNHISYDFRRDVLYWSNGAAGAAERLYTLDVSQGVPGSLPAPRTLPFRPSKGMVYHESQDLIYVYEGSTDTVSGLDPDTLARVVRLEQPAASGQPGYLSEAKGGALLIAGDVYRVSLRPRFANGGTTVGSIVQDICADAGLSAGDIDVVSLTQQVHGYVRAQPMEAQAAITPLMSAFLFDAQESEYKMKFVKRTSSAVAQLNEDNIGAHEQGQDMPDPVIITRTQEVEMAQAVSVHYIDPAKDYLQGSRQRTRVITSAVNALQLDLPIAMSGIQAKRLCTKLLDISWAERHRYELVGTVRQLELDPADVINVRCDGSLHTIRIRRVDFGTPGLVKIEGVATRITQLAPLDDFEPEEYEDNEPIFDDDEDLVDPPDEFPTQSPVTIPGSRAVLLDIPLLRDADNDAGLYAAMCGYRPEGWTGTTLFASIDGGATYLPVATVTNPAAIGGATTVLASGPTTIVDHGSTVNVILTQGTLASDTEANVFAGRNAAALGIEGRWEIIQWQTATLEADGSYTLSNLLRGRKGTEHNVGNHEIGDVFVALTSAAIIRLHTSTSDLDQPRVYKAVSVGANLADATAIPLTNRGIGRECYSPVHIKGSRNSSGDLTITWIRRTRAEAEWRDLVDTPLFEDAESYELEILDGVDVVRTFMSLTAATQVYSSADQVTDFGSNQAAVSVKVYQVSTDRARGFPGEATV
ncbi:MAG: phage tail protein [Gammaproteobacteria bacterium]